MTRPRDINRMQRVARKSCVVKEDLVIALLRSAKSLLDHPNEGHKLAPHALLTNFSQSLSQFQALDLEVAQLALACREHDIPQGVDRSVQIRAGIEAVQDKYEIKDADLNIQ